MNILWVKSGDLVPLDTGGKIRSFNLLKELARQHQVDLVTFYPEQENDGHPALNRYFRRVTCIPLKLPEKNGAGDYANYALNLFSLQPYSMRKYCQPRVARQVRALLARETYDVIVCDFFLTGAVIPWEFPCPKVLFTHNVEAQIWQRHFQVSRNPVWKAISWREYKTIARLEHRYLEQADAVLTVSDTDRDTFSKLIPREKITTIQTGVDVDFYQPSPGKIQPNVMVFTGSMDWTPNEDGILYFVDQILPLIRRSIPDAEVWVVGRNPSARVRELNARDSRIRVTGTVDDIRPYMDQAAVYVVPLRIGGGTRIKIFEAMAEGKAVVSTSLGAEGLPVTHDQNIILADQPDSFAARVVALMQDAQKRDVLGQAARRLVEENYSWSTVARQFAEVLASVAKPSAAANAPVSTGSATVPIS
ncbi:MAG: glycosyltransferase [Candidatus Acidiferrales bacterium]